MKYILLRTNDERLVPVIFPNFMIHADVAKYFGHILAKTHKMPNEPYSAGEVHFSDVVCHGKSSTLKIESKPSDSTVIETFDYTSGTVDGFTEQFILASIHKAKAEREKVPDNFDDTTIQETS